MNIQIHRAKYLHSQWYYYLKPERLTLRSSPPIFKWLFWVIALNKKEYERYLNKKENQHTFVYCPHCDIELISSDSLMLDKDYTYFQCKNCYTTSKWDFDLPCPTCIDYDKKHDDIHVKSELRHKLDNIRKEDKDVK